MDGELKWKCGWQGVSLEGFRRPGPGWRGEGGGGIRGHMVVGGRDDGLEPKGGGGRGVGPGGRSIATGLGRKPVGGCYSAEMRRPAIRSTAHGPIHIYGQIRSPVPTLIWRMDDGRKKHGGDSEWRDQCRRWTGNRNGSVVDRECHWKGSEGLGRDEGGRGGGSQGHRVVGGRDDGLEPKGG